MRSLTLVADEFGNLTEFVASHNDLTLQWYDFNFTLPFIVNVSEPSTKKGLDLADYIIKDYNENYYTVRIYNGSMTTAKMTTGAMEITSKMHTEEMETTGKMSTEKMETTGKETTDETMGNESAARFL